jgi:tetratricopeptide (TPR) repeat protein
MRYLQGGTMNNRFCRTAALAVSLIGLSLVLATPAFAQMRSIRGRAVSDKGEPIADAQIVIRGMDVKREMSVKTNKKGEYSCLLQGGVYAIGIHAQGYTPQFFENVQPALGAGTEVNFTLSPGQDAKLPIEMTTEERAKAQENYEKGQKRKASAAQVQAFMDAAAKLEQENKYAEAAEEYKKAIEKDNEQPNVHARLAEALAKTGKMDDALAEYDIAIKMKPDDAAILTNRGVLLSKMGKTAESQEAFKAAAKADPGGAGKAFFNLGVTLINSGQTDQAVDAFRQAIAADPNYAESYYQLGLSLSAKADTIPEAVKMLQKYVSMGTAAKPENVEVAKALIGTLSPSK